MSPHSIDKTSPKEDDSKEKARLHILHVDDDVGFLEMTKEFLETENKFEIIPALTIDEAYEKIKQHPIDLIVCDYELPPKNAIDFLKELRQQKNTLPFILFTGKGREEVARTALNFGADGYYNKQGSPETVFSELAQGIRLIAERRKIEETLKQEHEILEAVTKNVGAGLVIIGRDYHIQWTNAFIKRTKGKIEGKICHKWLFNSDEPCRNCGLEKIFSGAQPLDRHEHHFECINDLPCWFEIIITPIKDKKGDITAALEVLVDITSRKKLEESLETQKSILEDLYENAPTIYLTYDPELNIVTANKTTYQLLGYSKEEMVGRKMTDFYNEKSKEEFEKDSQSLKKNGSLRDIERQIIRKDGSIIDVIGDVSVKSNKEGKIIAIRAIFRDITQQKHVEKLLLESEIKHRQILELAGEGICTFDDEENIVFTNPRMAELLGYTVEEMNYKSIFQFVNPNNVEQVQSAFELLKQNKGKQFEQELIKKNGDRTIVHISATPITDETGAYSGAITFITDITEQKKMQKRMRDLAYQMNGLTPGESYLCDSHDQAFKAYADITFHNTPGLCIVREDPEKLAKQYGIKLEEMLLLASRPLKGFDALPDIQAISLAISKFLKANNSGIVLLDGIEYLLSTAGFQAIYSFIQEKHFDFLEKGASLIMPVNLISFTEREKALLTSELKILPTTINQSK